MSIPVVVIPEAEVCDCVNTLKKIVKKERFVDTIECSNEALLLSENHHSANRLFIEFVYTQADGKKKKRINFFFAYCPFCGKKVV